MPKCPKCGTPNGEWELIYADIGFAYVKCECGKVRRYQRDLRDLKIQELADKIEEATKHIDTKTLKDDTEDTDDVFNMSEEFTKEDFLKMFDGPLTMAYELYKENRPLKGDSWMNESVTSMRFLHDKLKEELKEYIDAPSEDRYKEICDLLNVVCMTAGRERIIKQDTIEQMIGGRHG